MRLKPFILMILGLTLTACSGTLEVGFEATATVPRPTTLAEPTASLTPPATGLPADFPATPALTLPATATPGLPATPTPNLGVTSAPAPDLIIMSMKITGNNACTSNTFVLGTQVVVRNGGRARAGTFIVELGGEAQTVNGLGAGEETALWFASSQGSPAKTLVIADTLSQVAESNEANNSLAQQLPLPTPPPACPTPTPTLTPTPAIAILSFTADRTQINVGDKVTFSWVTRGADRLTLSCAKNSASLTDLPLTGSAIITVAGQTRDQIPCSLWAYRQNPDGSTAEAADASVLIRLPCPDTYFFPVPASWGNVYACPAGPAAATTAGEQIFENGRMIWLQSTNAVYVLYNDKRYGGQGAYENYANTWVTGEPENDPALVPPTGYYQPLRGFGKIWREQSTVREGLGWATTPEQSYSAAYQSEWCTLSTSLGRPSGPDNLYLNTAGGQVIFLYTYKRLGPWPYWDWIIQ